MPIYEFACTACKRRHEEYQKITSDGTAVCPVCTSPSVRVPSVPHSDLVEFRTPIAMFSVAVEDIDEIRRLKRECPDADISDDPDDPDYGVPKARSRKAKNQILKASGFVEMS